MVDEIRDLTGAALNRAIATALGLPARFTDPESASEHGIVMFSPDWATNTDAALALCLEIAGRNGWGIDITPYKHPRKDEFAYWVFFRPGDAYFVEPVGRYISLSPAEALARLALAALREGA